jgi:hypothetical protein
MIVEGVTLAVVEDRQPSSKTREGGYRQPATWHSKGGQAFEMFEKCSYDFEG